MMATKDFPRRKVKHRVPVKALLRVASVAGGVQFGWALQLSLLTPYVQELGIPHQYASLIWLCGPISGMIVQPIVGHYSDQCTSSYGRRRPFIIAGAIFVVLAILVIAFAADIGYLLGDYPFEGFKPRAIVIFVSGFWLLDLANNTLQGPCRALLADYTGKDQRRTRRANAFFSLFMAVGNILGFATGAYDNWAKWLPFSLTTSCGIPCSNLKSAFLVGTIVLIVTTYLSVTAADEIPWRPEPKLAGGASTSEAGAAEPLLLPPGKTLAGQSSVGSGDLSKPEDTEDPEADDEDDEHVSEALVWELASALRDLPRIMWYILLVEALTWVAWFPFLLFDTDWMGREVYLGDPSSGAEVSNLSQIYDSGVHTGALGLMLNSVVLGFSSLIIDYSCRKIGPSRVWGLGNVIMAAGFASTAVITYLARKEAMRVDYTGPSNAIVLSSLAVFAILGMPLAVTYSVPYALTATYAEKTGGGQGLSMGVLNLAVVIPQVFVSLLSGPFDLLFGGGNLPSFLFAAVCALIGGVAAIFLLPRPPPGFQTASNKLRRTRSSPIP